MSRKPDIHRVLSRFADLNPPLGYPGGSCHLQDRIRQEVRSERNQGILLDHHLSGADKDPNDRYERAIYDAFDEGTVPGTAFGEVRISEHAQYRMDQKGITVADLRKALRDFQKVWSKETSAGFGRLIRGMQEPGEEFSFDSKSAGIRVYMRPLQVWEPGNKLRVWIRTVHPLGNSSVGNPVPPEECESFEGWSREYPEHGIDRLFPKRADLTPPLGYPGGPCHLMERVHQEVGNPRLRDRIVDSIEEGVDISNADASKVYSVEKERGVGGKFLSQMEITAHAQYRMDQRGITVSEVRLALKQFRKAFYDAKSQGSPQYHQWSSDMAWGGPIQWESPMGLTVVFDGSRNKAAIITAYWTGQSNPRPKDEEECGFAPAGRVAAGSGDCYEANGRYFMDKSLYGGDGNLRLVHGEVTGQGPLEGVNYGHAWVEDGNTVIDMSNGRAVRMPKAAYYALGNIEANDNMHKYTASEFRRKVLKHEHWGPWDLRTSTGL